MCGIVGLSLRCNHQSVETVVGAMADRIRHRGPDSGGYAASQDGTAHVGFRRLAIRDLNPRANQPMVSASKRSAIVFNGEVYNSHELAEKYLSGQELRTSGDTEVVLELIERHGIDILPELNGMFALAFVDLRDGRLTLTRDRMGKKPLYLYEETSNANRLIAFASELRSLKPFGLHVDPTRAELFFHFGYFPSPHTFYKNTTQVCPGEVVTLQNGELLSRTRYHDFTQQPWSTSDLAEEELDSLLADSVRLRKLSDVPLGSFLSGGIDSALVAAYLRSRPHEEQDSAPPTFTVAFADQAHDEADAAAATAAELDVPHRTIEIEEADLSKLALDYVDCYEQPYADSSGLVTMLLCRAVKAHVTVALSGDGGDEFFGGYARYEWFRKALQAQRAPHFARRLLGAGLSAFDAKRGHRLDRWLSARDPADLYCEIKRTWNSTSFEKVLDHELLENDSVSPSQMVRDVFDRTEADPLAQAACFDAVYYIPDDLQVKLDRASMQVALEVRCPLLDFRVANAGLALRTRQKYANGLKGKLKKLAGRHVSDSVLNRPKHGFNVPLARWLRGPMQDLIRDALSQQFVRESGWLNADALQGVAQSLQGGQHQNALSVWMAFSVSQHLRPERANPLFRSLLSPAQQRAA